MLRANLKGLSPLGVCAIVLTMIGLCSMPSDAQPVQAQEKVKADTSGDALPPGALARLGTLRWRHGDTVSFVAFPADGKTVLTASQDNVLRLWERETGKELRRFVAPQLAAKAGQPGFIGNVRGTSRNAMSPDGKIVATLVANNAVQLWETSTGKELRQIKTQPNVAAVVFTPDSKMLAVRGSNRTIYLMDVDNGNEVRQLQVAPKQKGAFAAIFVLGVQGNGDASAIAFAPDGKTVAASNSLYENQKQAYSLKVINVENGNVLHTIDVGVQPQGVNAVAYAPDGKTLAYSNLNVIKLIDPDTAKKIRAIKAPMGATMLVFAPDGKTLAAKGRGQVTRLFDTESGNETRQFGDAPVGVNPNQLAFINYNTAELRDLAFSTDGKSLAIGSGHVLRFFAVDTGKELPMAGGHRGPVNAVAASADGKTIVSRGTDNVIRRWDAATGDEIGQFDAPKGTTCAAFSPDLRLVALGNIDTTISVRDVATGKEIHQLTGHTNGTAVVAFAPNGKLLASRGMVEQVVRIFDVAKGTEIKQIALQPDVPANPNAAVFIRAGYYGNIGIGLAFSADSQSIAANIPANNNNFRAIGGVPQPAGAGNMLRIFDVSTAKETRQIQLQPQQSIVSIAFPPGGRVIAAENSDQTVTIWEIASGRERAKIGAAVPIAGNTATSGVMVGGFNRFGGGQPQASTFAFSTNGLLASKGSDHSVRVWDLTSGGSEIGQFKGHRGPIASLAFAPNGKTLVTGSNDTTLLVWDVASLKRNPAPQPAKLQAKEVETLWALLIGDDGVKAHQTIVKLAGAPSEAVGYFATQLKPATPPDVKQIDRWIADLDSSNFKLRGTAAVELEKLGELAVPALKKVLASPGSLETRRRVEPMVERLTGGVLSAEQIRTTRAIEVLEQVRTAEARELLETLAKGAPGAYITRQAQLALDGLSKQR